MRAVMVIQGPEKVWVAYCVTVRSRKNPEDRMRELNFEIEEPDSLYLFDLFVENRKIRIWNQGAHGSDQAQGEGGLRGGITVIVSEETAGDRKEGEYLITFILPCFVDLNRKFFDYFGERIRGELERFIKQLGIEESSEEDSRHLDHLLDSIFALIMYSSKLDDELMEYSGSEGLPLWRSREIDLGKGKIFLAKNVVHLVWSEYISYQTDSPFPDHRIFRVYSMIPAMLSRLYAEEYFLERRLSEISEKVEEMVSSAEPDLNSLLEASRSISYVLKLIQEEIGENVFDEPTLMEVYKRAMNVCGIKHILETLKERAEMIEGTVSRLISCWISSQTSESSRSLLLLSRSSSAMEKAFSSVNVAISVVALLSLISIFCDLMGILDIKAPPMTPIEKAAILAMPVVGCIFIFLYIRRRMSATRSLTYKLDLEGRWSEKLERASCYCEKVDPIWVTILRRRIGWRGLKYEARLTSFRGKEPISAEVELDRPASEDDLERIKRDLEKLLQKAGKDADI